MSKEDLKEVDKDWGRELVIVNCPEYCGKLLYLDKGAESSCHKHMVKQETFFCLEGTVGLTIEGKGYMLTPFARPKTILPGRLHSFSGITNALILEVGTHHDNKDVYRVTKSTEAKECPKLDDCPKIKRLFDKEMLDFQLAEAIRRTCKECPERSKRWSAKSVVRQ